MVKLFIPLIMILFLLFPACVTNPAMEQANIGDRYSEEGKWGEAISQYQKAIAIDPNLGDLTLKLALAYSNRAWDYNQKGQWADAIDDLNKAVEFNPNLAIAYNNRGIAYQGQGQSHLDAAYDFLNRLGDKDNAKIELEKAIESFTNSIDDLKKALSLKSDFKEASASLANVYNDRGHTYDLLKKWDEAIADCTEAINLNPNLAEAYNDRGYAYNGKQDWAKAVPDCTKAIELDPMMEEAYNNRGWAYHELGEYYKAIEDLDRAIELAPNMSVAYLNRAITYYYLKNTTLVVENCKKVLELTKDPDQVWSAKQLASSVGVELTTS